MITFNIIATRYESFIKKVLSQADEDTRHLYFGINAENINTALDDQKLFDILKSPEATVFLEGMGPVYAARLKGFKIPERISITDMIIQLLKHPLYKTTRPGIFFLGSRPGVALSAQTNLRRQFPHVNFVGQHHGYFKDDSQVVQLINEKKPGILFVGFGCPIQEKWIYENRSGLNVPVFFSCGGKFDYYASNRIRRAPLWMQQIGMEWLFRFFLEPHRLWRRYTIGLMKFLINYPRYSFRIRNQ